MILATAGCQEELVQPEVQQPVEGLEYVDITFDVTAPSGPQTKTTYGETVTFPTELFVEVYVGEDNEFGAEGLWLKDVKKVITPKDNSNTEWEVTLTLVKNYLYDIVFWAQRETAAPYTFDWENGKITANYAVAANDITRDAFYHLCENYNSINYEGASYKIGLKRPFAQINLGASDYSALEELYEFVGKKDSDLQSKIVTSTSATLSVPSVLNVLTGTADTPAAVNFSLAYTTPADKSYNLVADENDIKVTGKDAEGKEVTKSYTLVGTNYILANVNKPDNPTMDITMTFAYNGKSFDIEVPNVPYARNYQTNILGNYFTDESKFEVYIVPKFAGDHYYNMDLTLEEAFEVDRDVTYVLKEDQVITESLVLDMGNKVTIDLNGYNITAQGGKDVFYVTNGTLTVIDTNDSSEGTVQTEDKTAGYTVFADGKDAKVVIEGGNFVIGVDDLGACKENEAANSAVYTKNGATAEIKGGTFSVETSQTIVDQVNKTRFLINENDSNRGTITITGGTYVEFDPSNNLAEGAGTDFLADGYVAVPSEVEGKTVYTVKKNAVLAAVAAGNDAVTIEGTEEFVKPVIIESGKTFTLTLGEEAVLTSHNADPDTYASVFEVHGELVINGNGKVDAGEGAASNIAVWARGEGAKITINGGYFTNGADAAANASPVIYASKKDAQIIINGGTFEAGAQSPSDFSKPTYPVLNLYDSAAADGAMITVYGGTFINFDPSNPGTEVAAWNAAHPNGFVADGYTVESEEKDGKMYYTVVEKKGSSVISLADFLAAQVSANDWYQLTGMITKVVNTTYGNFYIQDENGTEVYVYGLTETQVEKNDKTYANLGLEVGDVVTFNSLRSEHNGAAQAGGNTPAYYISHTDAVVTYGIVGTLNGWGSTDDIKMASIYDKYHVAYDINMTTQDAFKIRTINDVNWSTSIGVNNNGQDGAFMPDAGFAAFVDGGSKNISVLKDGKYDVYYKDGNIYILSSGKTPEDITTLSTPVEPELKRADENTAAPGITLADLCIAGTFNSWSDTDMTLDGDWYVSPALELNGDVEFKFKEKNSWDKTLGGECYRQAFVGNEYPTTGGNNIKAYGLEGSYCIYLAKDQSRFKIEKYVAPGSEQIIDLTGEWTLGENAYDGSSSSSKQSAVINGTTYTDIIKLGTSSKYGTVTFTLPAGTTKLMFSAVAWKGNACSLKFTIGSSEYTQLINANTGATGNPQYVITTSDADNYVIDVSLDEDTEVTLTTVNKPRAIIWDLKAVVTK